VVVALFADDAGNLEVHQAGTGCQSDPFVFITACSSQRVLLGGRDCALPTIGRGKPLCWSKVLGYFE
jgi:hypothetical protein